MARLDDVVQFYQHLDELARRLGGPRRLGDCTRQSGWPAKGVYFFFEAGENRSTSGTGARIVRVGTHALTATSRTMLWKRLRAHRGYLKGSLVGGGNCRGSIFRRHLGAAIIRRDQLDMPTWDRGQSAPRDVRIAEHATERLVSGHICAMPFLWLEVSAGADGGRALRTSIEANSIALLSNWGRLDTTGAIDPPSASWLGRQSPHPKVHASGLWNVDHVDKAYDARFLGELRRLVEAVRRQ